MRTDLTTKWATRWEVHVTRWHQGPGGTLDLTSEDVPVVPAPSLRSAAKSFARSVRDLEWNRTSPSDPPSDVFLVEVRERRIGY